MKITSQVPHEVTRLVHLIHPIVADFLSSSVECCWSASRCDIELTHHTPPVLHLVENCGDFTGSKGWVLHLFEDCGDFSHSKIGILRLVEDCGDITDSENGILHLLRTVVTSLTVRVGSGEVYRK